VEGFGASPRLTVSPHPVRKSWLVFEDAVVMEVDIKRHSKLIQELPLFISAGGAVGLNPPPQLALCVIMLPKFYWRCRTRVASPENILARLWVPPPFPLLANPFLLLNLLLESGSF
jgi:hypothetical protein